MGGGNARIMPENTKEKWVGASKFEVLWVERVELRKRKWEKGGGGG